MASRDETGSERTPTQQRAKTGSGSIPSINLAGRTELTPGPLTKPSPVVRPKRSPARWLVPVIGIVVLVVVVVVTAIVWQSGL